MLDNLFYYEFMNSKFYQINICFSWIFIFNFILNFQSFNCVDFYCRDNNDFSNSECFNNIIKIDSNSYRAGEFVTTQNGELIIEYSEDSGNSLDNNKRLFYGLKKNGRYYFPNESPFNHLKAYNP